MNQCSVIIPAYNEEVLIGDCIDSILANQETFDGELEIIVIANACTDSTAEIAKSYDEVRDQIMNELVSKKSQDIQQGYIKQLMDKYDVILHTSELTPENKDENEK